MRVWSVARTAAEIAGAYTTELATAPAGLAGNWRFNEGSGATAADGAGTPQHAALKGSASWSADVHR